MPARNGHEDSLVQELHPHALSHNNGHIIVVVVVSDTCESVCMCTTPQTCKATSKLKRRAVLETWACTLPGN